MALTRKMLKAMGIDEEKIDQIIEAHTESVDALKQQRDALKADADKAAELQKEIDGYKKDDFKKKYEQEHEAFESYKNDIANQNAKAAKESAVRSYFESKGIKGKSLDIAVRGATREIEAVELDGEKIKDCKALDELVTGVFAGLVSSSKVSGTYTPNPTGVNGGGTYNTKADIMKIRNSSERQKAIAENPQLFGM